MFCFILELYDFLYIYYDVKIKCLFFVFNLIIIIIKIKIIIKIIKYLLLFNLNKIKLIESLNFKRLSIHESYTCGGITVTVLSK